MTQVMRMGVRPLVRRSGFAFGLQPFAGNCRFFSWSPPAQKPSTQAFPLSVDQDAQGKLFLTDKTRGIELPNIWLRDSCRCNVCVNQDTMQREVNVFQLPRDLKPLEVSREDDGINILWTDSHKSHHPWTWLHEAVNHASSDKRSEDLDKKVLWDSSIEHNPPQVPYEEVMNGPDHAGMANLTQHIFTHGFCFVSGVPVTPEATKELLERIGPIRNTHYGGFYDFVPDLALADTAYTNLALSAHTDTTYFSEPAGLQAFHMLSHTPGSGQLSNDQSMGGQSLLVDGFNVAEQLRSTSFTHYSALRKVKVPWHASGNQDVAIAPDSAYPVIEAFSGQIDRVRWNNDDRGILPPTQETMDWYEAARKWTSLLQDKKNEYWFQLEPGRVLIFDNWRVLHGRSAFEGLRRMCGAYISRDDFISRWRITNFPREKVILDNMHMRDHSS